MLLVREARAVRTLLNWLFARPEELRPNDEDVWNAILCLAGAHNRVAGNGPKAINVSHLRERWLTTYGRPVASREGIRIDRASKDAPCSICNLPLGLHTEILYPSKLGSFVRDCAGYHWHL